MSDRNDTGLDPADVGRLIEDAFDVGPVAGCDLIRHGFNDVYSVVAESGRFIARLSCRRARGPANVPYEGRLLAHLKDRGAPVAAPRWAKDGDVWRDVDGPEGARALMLFEIAPGEPSAFTRVGYAAAYGAGLARIHQAGEDYAGPPSRYRLDLDHLLRRPLAEVLQSPSVDAPTRAALLAIAADLEDRFAACEATLSSARCHGDSHGGNAHVATDDDGALVMTFFDFDDGGPGFLAYDLAVFLWSAERRRDYGMDAAECRTACADFLQGYRRVRAIPAADLAATALFVPIRQVWMAGEFAGRIHQWGPEAFQREVSMIPKLATWSPSDD